MRELENRDFFLHPKFRHNLWLRPAEKPEITYLTVSNGTYEIPSTQADEFFTIRAHCTGHNTIEEISKRSNVSVEKIETILAPFQEVEMTHPTIKNPLLLSDEEVEKTFLMLAQLFGEHLAETNITSDILSGKLKKEVVLGWLSETYHYIKFFPKTLNIAKKYAKGQMKEIIQKYACQEQGHEIFILKTLEAIGFKKQEIESSVPLVSTRTIQFILEDLFHYEPATVFIVASIIESVDYHDRSKQKFARAMKKLYGFPIKIWDPLFEHIQIDNKLEHQKLLEKNIQYVKKINRKKLNNVVNKLHDLKHAFDLQKLEIKNHYSVSGSYVPRQFISFFSI